MRGSAGARSPCLQETTGPVPEAPPPDQVPTDSCQVASALCASFGLLREEFVGYLKSKSEKNGYGFIVCSEIQDPALTTIMLEMGRHGHGRGLTEPGAVPAGCVGRQRTAS